MLQFGHSVRNARYLISALMEARSEPITDAVGEGLASELVAIFLIVANPYFGRSLHWTLRVSRQRAAECLRGAAKILLAPFPVLNSMPAIADFPAPIADPSYRLLLPCQWRQNLAFARIFMACLPPGITKDGSLAFTCSARRNTPLPE
jgi:hypothetical protein